MSSYFEIIGMSFCAGFGFLGGMIFLFWLGDTITFWWNDR